MSDSLLQQFWEYRLFTPDERLAIERIMERDGVTFDHAVWLWQNPFYTVRSITPSESFSIDCSRPSGHVIVVSYP